MQMSPNTKLLIGSMVIASVFVFLLFSAFEPRWATNDDVGMSMVAHGYGAAAIGSPNLVFSNVLWGYLVRAIPEINGILGYSIATLGVLVIVGSVMIFGLYRCGAGYVASLSALLLIMVRPVLFPQFTINAGLLLIGAIICCHLYARQNNLYALVLACILAFCSYLVRSHEFLLVLIVALPLLPWKPLLACAKSRYAFLVLVSIIAVSAVVDHRAYQGDEWTSFNELDPSRAPFTDFGAGGQLLKRPDILGRYGYSQNDVLLISKWFFVDRSIANPGKLNAMLDELGPLYTQQNSLAKAWVGVRTLWHPTLLPIVVAALFLAVLRPSWQVAGVWGLCVAAVFALGLLGRPGVLRVYIPLVCLLLIAPFIIRTGTQGVWRRRLALVVILVAALVNTSATFAESNAVHAASEKIRHELKGLPTSPIVAWGSLFPYEAAYPVLKQSQSAMSYRLYALDCLTLAPFSISSAEEKKGRGMTNLLITENGLPIIAREQFFEYLAIYCKEHLHGDLKEISTQHYGQLKLSWRRCEVYH
jgi:hypothetical protein